MRLVIVSNRLPIVVERDNEAWVLRPGSGGLVSALAPVLQARGGLWVGWPGVSDQDADVSALLASHRQELGYQLEPVWLTDDEQRGFYLGFSNEIVWPLFHDLQSFCNFDPTYWTTYGNVNEKFAEVVARHAQADDFVWVQDYHLMGLGHRLRQHGLGQRLGFFLHIPFPPPDIFGKLPWRTEVLESLLSYDVLGFQTPRDRDNFDDCARVLLPRMRLRRCTGGVRAERAGRTTLVSVCPIGIDYDEYAGAAATPAVTERAQALRSEMQSEQIVLGLDRLDYTKGIPQRLQAFRSALKNWPDLHRRMTLVQVVVPSREAVPQYQELKAEIEQLVAQINGEFTQPGWVPIHYVFRSLEREEMLAYYRAADVALVTPLKDGMNLVAKEYCACQIEGNGVLILSEFAGTAVQLRHEAVLVNPYDLVGVADAIHRGVTMPARKRRPAMRRARRLIHRQDVHWWVECFLRSSGVAQGQQADVEPVAAPSAASPLAVSKPAEADYSWVPKT